MDNKQYVICDKDDLVAVADALRAKSGSSDTLTVEELPTVVHSIEGGGLNTSDATAVAEDILLDKTAYANGEKIIGTFSIDAEIATQEEKIASQDTLIADIVAALEGKAVGGGINVPELWTVTYESAYGRLLCVSYLTIDENNNITQKSIRDTTSGTLTIIPQSCVLIQTEEVQDETSWGITDTYFPLISGIDGSSFFYYLRPNDQTTAVVSIHFNNASFSVKTDG